MTSQAVVGIVMISDRRQSSLMSLNIFIIIIIKFYLFFWSDCWCFLSLEVNVHSPEWVGVKGHGWGSKGTGLALFFPSPVHFSFPLLHGCGQD